MAKSKTSNGSNLAALKLQADTIEEAIAGQLQATVAHVDQIKASLSNSREMLRTLREKIDAIEVDGP